MRAKFDWYFGPSPEETKDIWDTGILTVDANVLLDLYRYNEKTREDILKAIHFFGERVWLPGQAAREFIRNRKTVIKSADKTFRDAEAAISDLQRSCLATRDQLRSHRLVPRDGLEEMEKDLNSALELAEQKIREAKDQQPDYLAEDPLLDRIMATFDGRVGDDPSPEEWVQVRKLGEVRRASKTPPGYLDGDKDGDKKYGDYLLWSQILQHAQVSAQPMIFVTSERKEDWWEKQAGQTVGPRSELLEEAATVAGQRILIYQTDQFLKFALARIGDQPDASSVADIREVDAQRTSNIIDQTRETAALDISRTDLARYLEGREHINARNLSSEVWDGTLRDISRLVFTWVIDQYPASPVAINRGWPDILVDGPAGTVGYEVFIVTTPSSFSRRVRREIDNGHQAIIGGTLARHEIVAVAAVAEQMDAVTELISSEDFELPESVVLTLGTISRGDGTLATFVPSCRVSQLGRRKTIEVLRA